MTQLGEHSRKTRQKVAAGGHTLTLGVLYGSREEAVTRLTFAAKRGERYRLQAETERNGFFSLENTRVWIVDRNGNKVSSSPS